MTDYGRPLGFGVFITPSAASPSEVVALAELADRRGLDLVTFQDHPYQPDFLDTWTLLSYVAARTSRIGLSGNVLNLPLRQPAVLARSVAALDLLSGGRVELGLGAGAFWEAIEAMGGTRLAPADAVGALEEAIEVIRQLWDVESRGGVRVDGRHYRVHGAKRGPAPAHPVGIWLGAYKPRMLRLVGRRADGWLPSLAYLGDGELARFALDGVDTFILAADDDATVQLFADEIAPAVRELVEQERSGQPTARTEPPSEPTTEPTSEPTSEPGTDPAPASERAEAAAQWSRLGFGPTPPPEHQLVAEQPWDASARPRRRPSPPDVRYSTQGRAVGKHLIDVHDGLRAELTAVRDVLDQVRQGAVEAAAARSVVNDLTMRQNDWTLGAYCASYCRIVTGHHSLEDASIFPHLRGAEDDLAPVLDRLAGEHQVIHEVLELLDQRLVAFIAAPDDFTGLQHALDLLTDTLLSHLSYEEDQLVEPLARLGFYPQQV